jgi:CheY-like chemotaxis protein
MIPNCLIISENEVFSSVLQRHLLNRFKRPHIKRYDSFASLKGIEQNEDVDVILLDNSISGAANYEVITYLRLKKSITTPVIYFSNIENDLTKARQKGANLFFIKPFIPAEVIKEIEIIISKKHNKWQ